MTTLEQKTYSREEAAKILGMGLATLDRRRYAGEIEEYRVSPHKIRFTEAALERYKDEHTGRWNAVAHERPEAEQND